VSAADQAAPVICLSGPTASGKTGLAIALCDELPVSIVSVDSAMVYRHMNIGSAKPDTATLQQAPHRLIDIREPWESYSAGDFIADVTTEIADIRAAGRVPLLTGGTMMYFHALQNGLADLPQADAGLRAELDARATEEGWPALHAELAALDPQSAAKIKPNDAQRIQRALEVCLLSGEPLSKLQENTQPAVNAQFLNLGLNTGLEAEDRQVLHRRIEQRLEQMLAQGFVAEIEGLLAMPEMTPAAPALRAVGYRQLLPHVLDGQPLAAAREAAVVATRRLAKRQLTWMRSMQGMQWLNPDDPQAVASAAELIRGWLQAGDYAE